MTTERIILGFFGGALVWLAVNNARHLVLPDVIIVTGIIAGLALSWFFPSLHDKSAPVPSLITAIQGLLVGSIVVYGLSIGGKALFGKQGIVLPASSKVVLNQTSLVLPEHEIPYEEIFYRGSDQIEMIAGSAHLRIIEANGETSKSFENVSITLSPTKLVVGDMIFDPGQIAQLEATTGRIALPREAIGFGLVKLAGLIGVFLGWTGALFAVSCGGVALALGFLPALTVTQGQRLDAATPMCVASIVWMILRSQLVLAGSLAILLGTAISMIMHRILERIR